LSQVHDEKVVQGMRLDEASFREPPLEMGILPFWFWNGKLEERELEWQLHEYRDKGITGLFIHGRFGLAVPYLSDEWFERTKFVIEKAKEIGVDIWIYDEMNWPSGTADKQVIRKYPHLAQKYLELVALNVDGPLFTFLEASDDRYVNTGNSKPIAAFACRAEEFEHGIKNLIDLTPSLSFEKVIPWEAPPGKWKLLYFLEKEIDYYIDVLNPEATERFLELTHEKYKQAIGKDFGGTVPGFYTDEPAMHYYHVGIDNFVVPWSSQMFKIFRQRRGYDLRPYLPALYASMGEETARIRYDFWRTLTEQYNDTYYKRIREWCDANGVLFTGHLLFEEWLRLQARCEGNIFKYLKNMHITGVDHLYPKIGTPDEPDQHVAIKVGSSAAHHYGSQRLLCESMGGTYWDCTLERMKWIANWEYVLGVNLFNNHGYHYSIEGERKRDWPPSQFYHHTWWKYYDQFTTYMARLGHVLSGGRHVAKILILYPINSIWTNYVPQSRNDVGDVIEADFYYLTDTLLRLHYDFDYVDEDVLNEASIKDGRICIADEEYSVLIIPPMTHIKQATFDAIRRFVKAGGAVIADTLLPLELLESNQAAPPQVKELFGVDPTDLMDDFRKKNPITITKKNATEKVFTIHGQGLHQQKKSETLQTLLNQCITPDVTISRGEVFYLHRIKDNYDLYFFVNTSQEEIGRVEISFERTGIPELWDPHSGNVTPINVYRLEAGRLVLQLEFAASASWIVVIKDEKASLHVSEANIEVTDFNGQTIIGYASDGEGDIHAKVDTPEGVRLLRAARRESLPPLILGEQFTFRPEGDNVFILNHWKMRFEEGVYIDAEYADPDYDDSVWLDVTAGAWEMQLPQERESSGYPVTLWYRTFFQIESMPPNTRLLVDGFSGREFHLYINGEEQSDRGIRSRIDAEIREVDIRPFLREGTNTIAVCLIVENRTSGILDLLKIIGDFSLTPNGKGFLIDGQPGYLQVGSWTGQGYPFYSGTGIYETEVAIPDEYLEGRLFLEVDCGEDVLEVSLNGGEGSIIPWHPYRLDITDEVKPGSNLLSLAVTNTLINMLEGVHKVSGILQPPRLVHEHQYTLSIE